ncbi:ribbon-helix-helix domain-containing protein [Solirhodobacter olei]|uniref:ribbon-helix-helix domain-containing protein n=1 Tax=Solirhodobacter olei TaxID=2493082 RepID=UPI0019D4EC62|nr:type II toxin-antitoxin system ParD family antitoxin [Solirhodobacter olei]
MTMQIAQKVSITVTPDMMQALRDSVNSGEFATTSEAMRDALRVWRRQRLEDAERLEALRARVRRSLEDPRPSLTADEAEAEMTRFAENERNAAVDAAR